MPDYEPVLTKYAFTPNGFTLDHYLQNQQGYEGLKKALAMTPDQVIEAVKASGLRGRGGAGFPTGLKWQFVDKKSPNPKYIVCNADESEPGTFKDHLLMERNPHLLIEGCLIGCYAIALEGRLHLHPRRVLPHAAAARSGDRRSAARRLSSARTSRARASTARSTSTAAPARTRPARKRRCSSRSKASARSRGSSRRFPAVAGLWALPDGGQQRRDALQRAAGDDARRRVVRRRSAPRRTAGRSCSASAATSSVPACSKRR